MSSISNPQLEIVQAINANDIKQFSAIIDSDVFNVDTVLQPLVSKGPALVRAAELGRAEIVQLLLKKNANVNACDASRATAAHRAILAGDDATLRLLLAHGANLGLKDNRGCTPLAIAVSLSKERMAALLIEAGAPFERDAFCRAAGMSVEIIQALLKRNVDVRALRDMMGGTPCHYAVKRLGPNQAAVIRMLVQVVGIDLNLSDRIGCTCLYDCATHAFDDDSLRELIELGADTEIGDCDGRTPLLAAVLKDQSKSALLLLAAGADARAITLRGETVVHFAAKASVPRALVHELVAAGADFNARDRAGNTAFDLASSSDFRAPTADELDAARRRIAAVQFDFVRERAFQVCVGLQSRGLDALQLCEILLHACGRVAPLIPFHRWWKLATTVKHFQQHLTS